MSYVATGKAPHDHALSAVTGEDCAVWRVVKDTPVCVEPKGTGAREVVYAPGNGALAFSPPAMTPVGDSVTARPSKAPEIVTESVPPPAPTPQIAAIAPAASLAVPPVATSAPPPRTAKAAPAKPQKASAAPIARAVAGNQKVLVVLGSFQDADRAAAAAGAAKGTRVIQATVDGRKMYRVVAGPFPSHEAEAVRRNASDGAWLLPL